MNTEGFIELLKTFHCDKKPSEDVYRYPDGGSFWLRLRPKDDGCYHLVVSGKKAIAFAKVCLGEPGFVEKSSGKYPLWRLVKWQ